MSRLPLARASVPVRSSCSLSARVRLSRRMRRRAAGADDDCEGPNSSPLGDLISSPLFYVTFGIAGGVAVVSQFEDAALLLSAFPIVGLTVLSKTSIGADLEASVERRRPVLEAAERATAAARAEARAALPDFYGPRRALLVDPPPPHLTGSLPGDLGFDPLGLGAASPDALDRAVELELLHARWAMLGAIGVLLPEALDMTGLLDLAEPVWWRVGAAKASGETLAYAGLGGFVIAGKQGVAVIALCQAVLMGGPEYARYVGIRSLEPVGVYLPGDNCWPGGAPFDPFKLADDPAFYEVQRVAEIKHGRLAMVATLGFAVQAYVTREGPVANLLGVPGYS